MVAVFLYASLTALATGLGALPFLFLREISPRFVAYSSGAAAGLMLGASWGLVAEGVAVEWPATLGGVAAGGLFMMLTRKVLSLRDEKELVFEAVDGEGARKMLLMLVVMTAHSFAEGVAVGVGFGGGATLGAVLTVAIALHNVPEGLAISAVLRPRGVSVARCAGWSVFSSLPQPLMAVPAFLFVETFRSALPWGLGFAAGAMVFMVLTELLPDALEESGPAPIGAIVVASTAAMVLFQRWLGG